jgi:hypothetical protein
MILPHDLSPAINPFYERRAIAERRCDHRENRRPRLMYDSREPMFVSSEEKTYGVSTESVFVAPHDAPTDAPTFGRFTSKRLSHLALSLASQTLVHPILNPPVAR